MAEEASWTLDELVRRVAVGLADPAYPGAPNGRVRQLPDRRAVRWYTTTGLVDRPFMQGRTALYGPRHLLQLVAVKRRQAEGRSLAEIQAELAGATDETPRRVAAVPDEVIAAAPQPQKPPLEPVAQPEAVIAEKLAAESSRPGRRARFWAEPPAGSAKPTPGTAEDGADSVTMLAAVGLPGGAFVVLPRRPDDDDISAIN